MSLFKRGDRAEADLAKAIAKRGSPAEGTIVSMRETGEARAEGVARQVEFELSFTTAEGASVRAVTRQFMNDITLTGLGPGEPVRILYDRDEPTRLIVQQSPKYVFVRNPNAAFDGRPLIAVPVAEAEQRGLTAGG
jgi:hypothetical protein